MIHHKNSSLEADPTANVNMFNVQSHLSFSVTVQPNVGVRSK